MTLIEQLNTRGFCILRQHFSVPLIDACRDAFWPTLAAYLTTHADQPNRGPHRHFLPMPFDPPCFAPDFFFDPAILSIVMGALGNRIVADQWGCDVPLHGSQLQDPHVDYQRPLFEETPNLALPPYMLCVSFGLIDIAAAHGPIEIGPGTHKMPRDAALAAVESKEILLEPQLLAVGDVLIRHPWAVHRGTPNTTETPRALVTIRYVRHWYADGSRDVSPIPAAVWNGLSADQQRLLRFAIK